MESSGVAKKRVYPKRVPGSVPASRRMEMVAAAKAGRSVHQVAADAPCATVVVMEEWLRDHERRMRWMESELRGMPAWRVA